ncbi:MAG: hypothetical protein CISAcid_15770, partial [uncultured Acidilobus sp. CIS]
MARTFIALCLSFRSLYWGELSGYFFMAPLTSALHLRNLSRTFLKKAGLSAQNLWPTPGAWFSLSQCSPSLSSVSGPTLYLTIMLGYMLAKSRTATSLWGDPLESTCRHAS